MTESNARAMLEHDKEKLADIYSEACSNSSGSAERITYTAEKYAEAYAAPLLAEIERLRKIMKEEICSDPDFEWDQPKQGLSQ